MTTKKYELTEEKREINGHILFRIRALISFGNVSRGDLGGWIEREENLSQVYGDAWVYGDAQVSGNARVYGDARVSGDAWVYGDARVYENAWVSGDAQVSGDAWVYGDAQVSGNARVYGDAWVYGDAQVYGDAWVYGDARVSFGGLSVKFEFDATAYIAASLNVFPARGVYHLFKRVVKEGEGKYHSCYNNPVNYQDGKITKAESCDEDKTVSCGGGLHVSTPFYWSEGDTLIAVEVKVEDIITCQSGKLRVRKLKTIGEVKTE